MILREAVDAGNSTFQPQQAEHEQTARKSKEPATQIKILRVSGAFPSCWQIYSFIQINYFGYGFFTLCKVIYLIWVALEKLYFNINE